MKKKELPTTSFPGPSPYRLGKRPRNEVGIVFTHATEVFSDNQKSNLSSDNFWVNATYALEYLF